MGLPVYLHSTMTRNPMQSSMKIRPGLSGNPSRQVASASKDKTTTCQKGLRELPFVMVIRPSESRKKTC
jgi:hypothetical protein